MHDQIAGKRGGLQKSLGTGKQIFWSIFNMLKHLLNDM